jgi:anti-anti-sigma factor
MLAQAMTSTHLDIESHVRHRTGVVRVQGEIDLGNIEQLVEAVSAATPAGGSVEVDLREVGFIDSAGVAGLNRCRRQALRVDADVLVLCGAGSPVARLLQWTGLARVLDVRCDPAA